MAEYLCKNGASVIDKDKFECSSLFFGICINYIVRVSVLWIFYVLAAGSGNLKLVQYLCENGANIVDDRNNESWTPQYNGNFILWFWALKNGLFLNEILKYSD